MRLLRFDEAVESGKHAITVVLQWWLNNRERMNNVEIVV